MKVLINQKHNVMINTDRLIDIYIGMVEDHDKDVYAIFAVVDFVTRVETIEMAYYYDEDECYREFHSISDFMATNTIARASCSPRMSS